MSGSLGARYCLTGDEEDDDFWGYARDASGLFTPLDSDGQRRVELRGLAPRGTLLTCLDQVGGKRALAGNAYLTLLDPSGAKMGNYFVNYVRVESVRPSSEGPDLVDATVNLWCDDLFPEAEWPWELRRTRQLTRKGMWWSLGPAGRHAWLSVALHHHSYRNLPDDPRGTVYELDGSHIVDEDSFYCALGEAVNGPGGYFGWNLDALDDCLRGRWGATKPFTLHWNHSDIARTHLAEESVTISGATTVLFEYIVEILREHDIDVVLR
ncbi:barstar family protein [Streptoalloteichus hindustanus]|uniref:Barstar, RNAse (Barnase) inhibitor n=1 Tax=Streptoalloteichus hindustanus TaxID=2017 RepID=A0A1M5FLX7_STRHI|nr:barstar family protein [Streptoalloteichus hindustanus]SHF92587.1 Barstar, RNAse (barnase) inhibitor [Streptoalloteichus hindustanus]